MGHSLREANNEKDLLEGKVKTFEAREAGRRTALPVPEEEVDMTNITNMIRRQSCTFAESVQGFDVGPEVDLENEVQVMSRAADAMISLELNMKKILGDHVKRKHDVVDAIEQKSRRKKRANFTSRSRSRK